MNDKKQTAVEWLTKILENQKNEPFNFDEWTIAFEYAKEIEKKEKLKYELFVGKTMEIIGSEKTIELLKQCYKEII